MIVVEYDGTAYRVEEPTDETKQSGRDEVHTNVKLETEVRFLGTLEFRPGHVNLEAYAPSRAPDCVAETIQYDLAPENVRVDTSTVETTMSGTWKEWVTQARRWISERPSHDVISALEVFKGWGCTSDTALSRAIAKVEAGDVDTEPITPERPEA